MENDLSTTNRTPPSRKTQIRECVARFIGRLTQLNAAGCASGEFADLRDGAGKAPNASAKAMCLVVKDIPDELRNTNGAPTKEEWAISTAETLYAWHHQGHSRSVHRFGQTMGRALRQMYSDRPAARADEAFSEKLYEISTIQTIEDLAIRLRNLVAWMSSNDVKLDYVTLAADLYDWQFPERRPEVFMRWATDFHRSRSK